MGGDIVPLLFVSETKKPVSFKMGRAFFIDRKDLSNGTFQL